MKRCVAGHRPLVLTLPHMASVSGISPDRLSEKRRTASFFTIRMGLMVARSLADGTIRFQQGSTQGACQSGIGGLPNVAPAEMSDCSRITRSTSKCIGNTQNEENPCTKSVVRDRSTRFDKANHWVIAIDDQSTPKLRVLTALRRTPAFPARFVPFTRCLLSN